MGGACFFQELSQQVSGGKGGDRRQAGRGGSLLRVCEHFSWGGP